MDTQERELSIENWRLGRRICLDTDLFSGTLSEPWRDICQACLEAGVSLERRVPGNKVFLKKNKQEWGKFLSRVDPMTPEAIVFPLAHRGHLKDILAEFPWGFRRLRRFGLSLRQIMGVFETSLSEERWKEKTIYFLVNPESAFEFKLHLLELKHNFVNEMT